MSTPATAPSVRATAGSVRRTAWIQLGVVGPILVVLLATNLVLNPARFQPGNLAGTLGLAAPILLLAMASTPAVLGGGGGIDISIGPMVGLLNVVLVERLFMAGTTSPWVVVPAAVGMGLGLGVLNGLLVVALRLQPIVATLATFLVFAGLAPFVMPQPEGFAPGWVAALSSWASFVPVLVVALIWWAFRRMPAHGMLLAVGGSDRSAYSAGLPVSALRLVSYACGGVFAAAAALSLTGLIGSGDPTLGPTFTLQALAAVALGGVSLGGGRGGLFQAAAGALAIVLVEMMLTSFQASSFVLNLVYGLVLLAAVVINALTTRKVQA